MLRAIGQARRRVYLSTFIFGNDAVGASFAAALARAAERGCDVRLLMDGGILSSPCRMETPSRPQGAAGLFSSAGAGAAPALHQPAHAPQDADLRRAGGVHRRHEYFRAPSCGLAASRPCAGRAFSLRGSCRQTTGSRLLLDWRFVTAHAARMAADPGASILTPRRSAFLRKGQRRVSTSRPARSWQALPEPCAMSAPFRRRNLRPMPVRPERKFSAQALPRQRRPQQSFPGQTRSRQSVWSQPD